MRELGIDLAAKRPQRLSHELAEQADILVTMGCGDACPLIPGKRYIDWELSDPKGRPIEEVRATRDDINRRVADLLTELESGVASGFVSTPPLNFRRLLSLSVQPNAISGGCGTRAWQGCSRRSHRPG